MAAPKAHPVLVSDSRDRLRRLCDNFNDDEIDTMLFIARRLQRGRASYGPLNLAIDQRDWRQEESEEHADALMYRAFAELSKLRKR